MRIVNPVTELRPWDDGQSTEVVLGRAAFTSSSVKTFGQSSVNKAWGLAVSENGTLFAVDRNNNLHVARAAYNRLLVFYNAPAKTKESRTFGPCAVRG